MLIPGKIINTGVKDLVNFAFSAASRSSSKTIQAIARCCGIILAIPAAPFVILTEPLKYVYDIFKKFTSKEFDNYALALKKAVVKDDDITFRILLKNMNFSTKDLCKAAKAAVENDRQEMLDLILEKPKSAVADLALLGTITSCAQKIAKS